MDYLKTNLNWEDFFTQELVTLEEKITGFDTDSLNKSKLRSCLENKILDWKKYESWVQENAGCASLKTDIAENILKNFIANSQQAFDIYSNYDFWNEDLLPIFIWEDQLVVFGLQYNENLKKIKNHVFILAPPEILTYFAKIILDKTNDKNKIDELEELEKSYSMTASKIEGLELDIKAPVLDFKNINSGTPQTIQTSANLENQDAKVWDFITERHEEYSFEAKKQFSAYLVLKIDDNSTAVFKMDADLEKINVNKNLFKYNLSEDNVFSRVYKTGVSESFNISQLGLNLANFKYVCITALKRSQQVVGFLVGFKDNSLSENDQTLLEDLAKESAA